MHHYAEIVEVCGKLRAASELLYATGERVRQEQCWQIKLACTSVQAKAAKMLYQAAKNRLVATFAFSMEESLAIARYIYPIIQHNEVARYCRDCSHYLSDEHHPRIEIPAQQAHELVDNHVQQ